MSQTAYLQVTFRLAVAVLFGGLFSPAKAESYASAYASTAPRDCRTIGKPS